jgi:hypothetical protein
MQVKPPFAHFDASIPLYSRPPTRMVPSFQKSESIWASMRGASAAPSVSGERTHRDGASGSPARNVCA